MEKGGDREEDELGLMKERIREICWFERNENDTAQLNEEKWTK